MVLVASELAWLEASVVVEVVEVSDLRKKLVFGGEGPGEEEEDWVAICRTLAAASWRCVG